jgi:hypothetical protein
MRGSLFERIVFLSMDELTQRLIPVVGRVLKFNGP